MRLAEYLRETGRTHESLANAVGSDVSSVTRWSLGTRIPSVWFAVRISEATDGAVPVTSWDPPRRGAVSTRRVTVGKTKQRRAPSAYSKRSIHAQSK